MGADNIIYIKKHKKNWYAWEQSASNEPIISINAKPCDTEEEAYKEAKRIYLNSPIIEYGIQIIDPYEDLSIEEMLNKLLEIKPLNYDIYLIINKDVYHLSFVDNGRCAYLFENKTLKNVLSGALEYFDK